MGQRRAFTLVELMLALGIIALAGTVILYRSKPMLDYYRFSHGAEKLKREIAFSKRIAKTASTFIEFSLEQKGNQIVCMRKTDEPLNLKGSINSPIIIPSIYMDGEPKKELLITSSGWIENDAVINIFLGNQRKTIDARKDFD